MQLRRIGREWVGRCPLPDHDDKSPSFTVNAEKGVWHCFGCGRGGDVIELARYAWGYERDEAKMAAADLLREYGYAIPEPPAKRRERWDRQAEARAMLEDERVRHLRTLVYRLCFAPWVRQLPESMREECGESAWEASVPIARRLYETRMGA